MAKNIAKRKSGGGVGGVTPAERAESTRYGRGQGKTKRANKMKGANAKGSATRDGQIIGKKAFAAAKDAAGESWKTMSKEAKTAAVLKKVPAALSATEAQGVLRALGIRILPLGGDSTAALDALTRWGTERGVNNPAAEAQGAVTSRSEGESPKQVARKKGSGVKGDAPKGRTAKRVKKRGKRITAIVERAAADSAERGAIINEKELRVSGDKAEAVAAAPLPKGAKYTEIEYVVDVARSTDSPGGITVEERKATKKVMVITKGKTAYLDDGKGGFETVPVKDLKEALSTGNVTPAMLEPKKGKSSPTKQEFPKKMEDLTASGKDFNKEFIIEVGSEGFNETNRKIYEGNKIRLRDGQPIENRYNVAQYVDEAFPGLDRGERAQIIVGIKRKAAEARKAGKPLAGDQKNAKPKKGKKKTIKLRPQTAEEGRAVANSKETRAAAGRAAPLEPVKVEGRKAKRARKARVASVGSVLSSVMESGAVVSPEAVAGSGPRAKRSRTAKPPTTELEKQMAAVRKTMDPRENRVLSKIAKASRSGFTKPQVKKMVTAGVFGKVTPKVKAAARMGGYSSIVIAALNFLKDEPSRKKRD